MTAFAVLIIDQLTKYFIYGKQYTVIEGFLYISEVKNTGAGFGVLQGNNTALIFLTLIFAGVLLYYYDKIPKKTFVVASSALLLGGAAGNLIDRVFAGFVKDFINFTFWPAFNIADMAITIGGIVIIIYLLRKK